MGNRPFRQGSQHYRSSPQAQSGTRKRATFAVSILQKINSSIKMMQAVVLAPTCELALQIHKVIVTLGNYMDIQSLTCMGGTNVREDMAKLHEGIQVVVGTRGRVFNIIKRGAFKTDGIKILCLNEADEMLSQGFKL